MENSNIWISLIGFIATLTGVFITAHYNKKQFEEKLKYETEERDKERKNSMRKDIYVEMSQMTVEVSKNLSELPQMNPTQDNLWEGLQNYFQVSVKVQLIAEPETVLCVSDLTNKLSEIFTSLLHHANKAYTARNDMEIAKNAYNKSSSDVDRILRELTILHETGEFQKDKYNALSLSLESSKKDAEQNYKQMNQADSIYRQEILNFLIPLSQEMKSIMPLQLKVMKALRNELGLETDMASLELQSKKAIEFLDTQFSKILSDGGGIRG